MTCYENRFNGPIPQFLAKDLSLEKRLKNSRLYCELVRNKIWRQKHSKRTSHIEFLPQHINEENA